MKGTNVQAGKSFEEHSANQSSIKDHTTDQSQEVSESSRTYIDNERKTITEKRITSSDNIDYESKQDEMNDRRDQDANDSYRTREKKYNNHQYPSSDINIEIRNQPPIKLVLDLFGDDKYKEVIQSDQNNQKDRVELQQADSSSSNINEDKKRGSSKKSQEKGGTKKILWPEDGNGKNRQKRIRKKSKTKDTPAQRGKEQNRVLKIKFSMISAIVWNIRGVRPKNAIHRLKNLININNYNFEVVFEPFLNSNKIDGYKRLLGFQHYLANTSEQI